MSTRDLSNASRDEVAAYFEHWVRGGDQIVTRFAQQLAQREGPVQALAAGAGGLQELFAWVVEEVRFVDDVPDDDLPRWYLPGRADDQPGRLSPVSARLADGISRHYGEVLVRALPGVRWQVGDEPRHRGRYLDQNWPLIVGPGLAVNPLRAVALVVREARRDPEDRRLDYLSSNFERYHEIVTRGGAVADEPSYWVDEVDDGTTRQDGWCWEIGLDGELAALPVDALSALTATLAAVPGVERVEHAHREAWLVAGDADPDALRAATRGWAARY